MNIPNEPAPQTLEEAKEYLLAYLEQKYDEEFIFAGYEEEKQNRKTEVWNYRVDFAPASNPLNVFYALASSDTYPSPKDEYGKYLFKEEAEAICGDICKDKDYIESYTVELNGVPTNAIWTERHTMEDYMGEGSVWDPHNYVTVYLKDGLTDEEYAEQLSDLMEDLVVAPCAIKIEAQANNEMIYWNNIYSDYKPETEYGRILEKIINQKLDNVLIEEHTRRLEEKG